eukprot:g243.t1
MAAHVHSADEARQENSKANIVERYLGLTDSEKKERFGFWFSEWGKGPDAVMPGLWYPVLLTLAALDGTCNSYMGMSSGADNQKCSPDASWNETVWLAFNGSSCGKVNSVSGEFTYTHDTTLAGCSSALSAYRNATQYTCNCTGVHSYVLGLRVGNLQSTQGAFNLGLMSILTSVFAAYTDYCVPKTLIWITYVFFFGTTIGMGVLGRDYLWVVGWVSATFAHISFDIMYPPFCSTFDDIANDDNERGRLGALKQFASFGGQVFYIGIVFAMTYIVTDNVTQGILAPVIAGIWMAILIPVAVQYIKYRPPKKKWEKGGISELARVTFVRLFIGLKSMYVNHSEAFKYLIMSSFASNGCVTILGVFATYFAIQMKLTGQQVLIVSGAVLVCGALGAYALSHIMRKKIVSFKRVWQLLLAFWIVLLVLTPLVGYRQGDFLIALTFGGFGFGIGLSFYFSIGYPAYLKFVPEGEIGLYTGLYTFVTNATSWIASAMVGFHFNCILLFYFTPRF